MEKIREKQNTDSTGENPHLEDMLGIRHSDSKLSTLGDSIDAVWIKNFPMPPSSNQLYANASKGRVKASKYKAYRSEVARWYLVNRKQVQEAKKLLEKYPDFIRIDTIFLFPEKKLFSEHRKVKKLDASNRIKATHDIISDYLGIDDSKFFTGFFGKFPAKGEARVHIRFSPIKWEVIAQYLD